MMRADTAVRARPAPFKCFRTEIEGVRIKCDYDPATGQYTLNCRRVPASECGVGTMSRSLFRGRLD
jgi:hypothetical protein